MSRTPNSEIASAEFIRPETGPKFTAVADFRPSGRPAWQSNGGPARANKERSFPFTLEVAIPAKLRRVHLLGIFARYAGREHEAAGTLGATIHLLRDNAIQFRQDLHNGRHYSESEDLTPIERLNGDGTSLQTVGQTVWEARTHRVDVLTVDVPNDIEVNLLRFKDLGSIASFAIFDVFFEFEPKHGCPFHTQGGGVPLSEVGAALRLGDRVKFSKALSQLEEYVGQAEDLDEARGQATTFMAVVTSTSLELGAGRSMHRHLLDFVRLLDGLSNVRDIVRVTRTEVEQIASFAFREAEGPSAYLVDRALALVERNFARPISDSIVADQLGLSTSHFRYLFRQATGQPFHKYLVNLRLEKARQMLLEQELGVSEVARAVGFTGLSHFSRAFAQRFSQSPTSVRRSGQHA